MDLNYHHHPISNIPSSNITDQPTKPTPQIKKKPNPIQSIIPSQKMSNHEMKNSTKMRKKVIHIHNCISMDLLVCVSFLRCFLFRYF